MLSPVNSCVLSLPPPPLPSGSLSCSALSILVCYYFHLFHCPLGLCHAQPCPFLCVITSTSSIALWDSVMLSPVNSCALSLPRPPLPSGILSCSALSILVRYHFHPLHCPLGLCHAQSCPFLCVITSTSSTAFWDSVMLSPVHSCVLSLQPPPLPSGSLTCSALSILVERYSCESKVAESLQSPHLVLFELWFFFDH
ncbi:hypothetical protein PoB_000106500 [Plakobranchus ocellatus]|uniref:Uncharacterized protein n=1 Tax=Plakobranchus ocellatus TaxID=259542 RepID=A0AAV3XVW9_9GAST|nr:hypothetical protein PoB_000106500 [Plakobranchus ocellatus]